VAGTGEGKTAIRGVGSGFWDPLVKLGGGTRKTTGTPEVGESGFWGGKKVGEQEGGKKKISTRTGETTPDAGEKAKRERHRREVS